MYYSLEKSLQQFIKYIITHSTKKPGYISMASKTRNPSGLQCNQKVWKTIFAEIQCIVLNFIYNHIMLTFDIHLSVQMIEEFSSVNI